MPAIDPKGAVASTGSSSDLPFRWNYVRADYLAPIGDNNKQQPEGANRRVGSTFERDQSCISECVATHTGKDANGR